MFFFKDSRQIDNENKNLFCLQCLLFRYSFGSNCRGVKLQSWEKIPQVHLIIITE